MKCPAIFASALAKHNKGTSGEFREVMTGKDGRYQIHDSSGVSVGIRVSRLGSLEHCQQMKYFKCKIKSYESQWLRHSICWWCVISAHLVSNDHNTGHHRLGLQWITRIFPCWPVKITEMAPSHVMDTGLVIWPPACYHVIWALVNSIVCVHYCADTHMMRHESCQSRADELCKRKFSFYTYSLPTLHESYSR